MRIFLCLLVFVLFVPSCLTGRSADTAPLPEPVANAEAGYSYQSPIDPAELKTWELSEAVVLGIHPMYGVMADEYRTNPDKDGVFLYVDMFYVQACPVLGGLMSFCLVDQDMFLHAYVYDLEAGVYKPGDDSDGMNAFKRDLDAHFGINTTIQSST